jgi:hypothetical protein
VRVSGKHRVLYVLNDIGHIKWRAAEQ